MTALELLHDVPFSFIRSRIIVCMNFPFQMSYISLDFQQSHYLLSEKKQSHYPLIVHQFCDSASALAIIAMPRPMHMYRPFHWRCFKFHCQLLATQFSNPRITTQLKSNVSLLN